MPTVFSAMLDGSHAVRYRLCYGRDVVEIAPLESGGSCDALSFRTAPTIHGATNVPLMR
jgi:hypothetical protein